MLAKRKNLEQSTTTVATNTYNHSQSFLQPLPTWAKFDISLLQSMFFFFFFLPLFQNQLPESICLQFKLYN